MAVMFVVYSKVNCTYCEGVEKLFKLKNIQYKKYLLNVDYTREQFIERFGSQSTFPKVLTEDGELIGGAAETVKYLKENKLV